MPDFQSVSAVTALVISILAVIVSIAALVAGVWAVVRKGADQRDLARLEAELGLQRASFESALATQRSNAEAQLLSHRSTMEAEFANQRLSIEQGGARVVVANQRRVLVIEKCMGKLSAAISSVCLAEELWEHAPTMILDARAQFDVAQMYLPADLTNEVLWTLAKLDEIHQRGFPSTPEAQEARDQGFKERVDWLYQKMLPEVRHLLGLESPPLLPTTWAHGSAVLQPQLDQVNAKPVARDLVRALLKSSNPSVVGD